MRNPRAYIPRARMVVAEYRARSRAVKDGLGAEVVDYAEVVGTGPHCSICGDPIRVYGIGNSSLDGAVTYAVPIARGGSHARANAILMCGTGDLVPGQEDTCRYRRSKAERSERIAS